VLKKIDWYIIKRFLGSFGFTMMLLVSIAISIDLSEKIDNFIEHHLTFKEVVLGFYLPFVPYIVALLGSYFIFITVIFFTSQMAAKSEIIAIFNSGVGYYRLMVPYVFSATLLAGFLWFSNNYLVPWSNKTRLAFENQYISHQMVVSNRNIHRKINDTTYVYFELYDNTEKQAQKFSVEGIKNNILTYKIVSEKATFDTAKKEWTLFNYIERNYYAHSENLNKGAVKIIPMDLNPNQFVKRWTYVEELTTPELEDKIADLREQGAEYVTAYQLELYRRTSTAFGVIILSVIGMTIASVKMRGGLGMHLVIGIAICSIFEVIQKFSVTFALNANLPAVVAVWMPNIVALIIGAFLVARYQK
jgi:lipopolysaccharide export system permease protein